MSKKLFLSKRSCAIFFVLFLLGMGALFKGPIFHYGLKKYVSYKIPLDGEWDFDYSYLSLQKKGIVFHDINLFSEGEQIECKIGKVFCMAPAIENISLSNQYYIEDLDIYFREKVASKKSLSTDAVQSISTDAVQSILHSLKQVEIRNGRIIIPSSEMKISLAKSISSQKVGEMIFSQEGQGQIKVEVSTWANQWIMDLEAKQSSLAFYKDFADFFIGEKSSNWQIEKGKLDGRAFFSISSTNKVEDARMHMNLLGGKVRNDVTGILSSFDRAFFDLSYPVVSASESFIENIKISSSVDKAEISVYDEDGEDRFCFKDLSGYFTIDAFKEAAMEISGFIDDRGRRLPVKLLGRPAFKNKKGLEVDLSLELDPIFGQKANVNVVCAHVDGALQITSRLDSLEVPQMLILQECLSLVYPDFRNYLIRGGTYSGDLFVKIDRSGIEDFTMRNLECEKMEIYAKSSDVHIDAKTVSGEIELEFFDQKKTAVKAWQVKVVDANIIAGREEELPYHFEHTNIEIAVKDDIFIDSYINTQIGGVKGLINIDGTWKRPVFDVSASAKGGDALCFLTGESRGYDNQLQLMSRIEKKDGIYSGTGLFSVQKDKLISEISFTTCGSNKSDVEIEFSSKNFSGEFFPFFNEIAKFDWSLTGEYQFAGHYKDKNLLAEIAGKNCTYKERHSFIKNAEGKAAFHSVIGEGIWALDMHLTAGHKKVIDGRNLCLETAHLIISSKENFFQIRDFKGCIEMTEFVEPLLVKANKVDFYRSGKREFNIAMHNSYLELCRFSGVYHNDKVFLAEDSHILDKEIDISRCNLFGNRDIALSFKIDTNDVVFPNIVREKKFKEITIDVSVVNDAYKVSLKNEESSLSVDGEGSDFILDVDGSKFIGNICEDEVTLSGGRLCYGDKKLQVDSVKVSREGFTLEGEYEQTDASFKGLFQAHKEDNYCYKGRGRGAYKLEDDRDITIESTKDLSFIYDRKLTLEDGAFSVCQDGKKKACFSAKSIVFHNLGKKISLHGVKGRVGKRELKESLGIEIKDEEFEFTAEADILLEQNDFWLSGHTGERTYVVKGKEIHVTDAAFRGNKKSFIVDTDVQLCDESFNLCTHLYFDEKTIFHVEGTRERKTVLELDGCYNEGIDIFRCKGDALGVMFDLTPFNKFGKKGFATKLNLDLEKMRVFLPEGVVEFIDRLHLSRGLELIGDACTEDGISFTGVLKGTDFNFLDYSLSSLFANVNYRDGVCSVTDFSIADRSFTAGASEMLFDTRGDGCKFDTKSFQINNLRPCLLSEKGERKKITNPFMLEKVDFFDVKGNLADMNTIKGRGNIRFVNSFDRQSNVVFDFAKEIIGRIGLDPVLMVPVIGEMDFSLADGKMNFLRMQNTFSDKERSYFYLWHKEPSYLDFDGKISINIRMKQYVLFKFAELFVIAIDGPVSKPKIFLK